MLDFRNKIATDDVCDSGIVKVSFAVSGFRVTALVEHYRKFIIGSWSLSPLSHSLYFKDVFL